MALLNVLLGLLTIGLYVLVSDHHHVVSFVLTDNVSEKRPNCLLSILRGPSLEFEDSSSQRVHINTDAGDSVIKSHTSSLVQKSGGAAGQSEMLESDAPKQGVVVDKRKSFTSDVSADEALEAVDDEDKSFSEAVAHSVVVDKHKSFDDNVKTVVLDQKLQAVDDQDKSSIVEDVESKNTAPEEGQRVCLHGEELGSYAQIPCKMEELPPRLLPDDATVVAVAELPFLSRYMPEVGNGHVATVVQSNTVYMNGLYNGANVSSHRARIPSTAAVMATIVSPASGWTTWYRMDFAKGVFSELYIAEDFNVTVNRYAHRELTRLLVTEVIVNRTATSRPVTIAFTVNNGTESEDIDFEPRGQGMMSGKTKEPEYPDMAPVTDVTVVYSTVLPNMTFDSITQAYMPFFTSVSTSSSDATQAFNEGMDRMTQGTLFSSHVAAWYSVWERGRIDMTGNVTMALSTYATLYYLMSAVPLKPDSQWPFVGMAPGGLAHGAAGKDYEGHVFWDQDTWMFPPITLLHSDIGRIIVGTRLRTHAAALKYANMTGYSGARYPWESAFTGLNVSPSVSTTTYENHITGDTAWMMRQYLQQTKDTKFLSTDGGYQALSDMAAYWLSHVTLNETSNLYEIRDVMGPDEYHSPVNNSIYTNVIAAQTLYTAMFAALLTHQTPKDEWQKVAQKMYIPYDSDNKYHPEFDGYTRGTVVKQADVILLGYPLEWPMSSDIRMNDLKYYATVTPSGPAMTWGMFAANWLQVDKRYKAEADAAFYKGTYNIKGPFKIWTENADGTGAINFHTGMGGYLQSLLFGYAGLNLNDRNLGLDPVLPPSLTSLSVTGIDYDGDSLDLSYNASHMNVTLTKQTGTAMVLHLIQEGTQRTLDVGVTVTVACQPAYILQSVT